MSPELQISILNPPKETEVFEVQPGGKPFSRIFSKDGGHVLVIGTCSGDGGQPRVYEIKLEKGDKADEVRKDSSRWGEPKVLNPNESHVRVFANGATTKDGVETGTRVVYFYSPPQKA